MTIRKKIVVVSGFYPIVKGGAEYQMRLIADALRDDYEVVFLYLGDAPSYFVDETKCFEKEGYKVYELSTSSKMDRYTFKYFHSRELIKILKLEKPDYVYQRVLKFMSLYLGIFSKQLNYEYFIHIADLFSISFDNTIRGRLKKIHFNILKRFAPEFIVQTSEQAEILKNLGTEPKLQIYNIHPSVESEIVKKSICLKSSITDDKYVLWVANVKPIKRLEFFLDLAEYFQDDISYKFIIIGDIQDVGYAAPLLKRAKSLSSVIHYGGKDNVFINHLILSKANLIVNTSDSEGFSNVFIQAWMRGVPVLSLNSNPDKLFDKYPCFGKFCNGSISELIKFTRKIIESENNVESAWECYEISSQLFAQDNNIKYIESLFK